MAVDRKEPEIEQRRDGGHRRRAKRIRRAEHREERPADDDRRWQVPRGRAQAIGLGERLPAGRDRRRAEQEHFGATEPQGPYRRHARAL